MAKTIRVYFRTVGGGGEGRIRSASEGGPPRIPANPEFLSSQMRSLRLVRLTAINDARRSAFLFARETLAYVSKYKGPP